MGNGCLSEIMTGLTRVRDVRSARSSSWDQTGRNQDAWIVMPGETLVLADIKGPGCITHIWMTQFCRRLIGPSLIDPRTIRLTAPVLEMENAIGAQWEVNDPDYYRKVLLKMFCDDQEQPSVLVPLGDFFCMGNSIACNFASLPFTASSRAIERHKFGGTAALNCYFPMPFNKHARIEVENQNDIPYGQYFYIDYELYREPLGKDLAYFHAQWRRNNPCNGWGPEVGVNTPEINLAKNLNGNGNYIILDTEGRGHYVGCNLSVTHFQGTWWGEGDDMIFIDGETWPPSLHGTGSEDYFNQAWGMQPNAYLMNGSALHEGDLPGYQISYRFHLVDPVVFSRSIRVTMEHGHANHLSDDWSSTAYWYQTLPTKPFSILPVEQRIPIHPTSDRPDRLSPDSNHQPDLSDEQRHIKSSFIKRYQEYTKARDRQFAERADDAQHFSEGNIEQAKRIRQEFDERD